MHLKALVWWELLMHLISSCVVRALELLMHFSSCVVRACKSFRWELELLLRRRELRLLLELSPACKVA